jgi:hypothetical protein
MGIDFLDRMFRIERAFGIPFRAFDLNKLDTPRDRRGYHRVITCEQMLKWVELTLREHGHEIPEDCWPRLRACIAETVGIPIEQVTLESRIIQDLGFT